MQATSCGTPNLIQTGNQFTQATTMTTGLRTPGIPQVQVIPQLHSPPYQISQFPYNQQQIMLQNAMQGMFVNVPTSSIHLVAIWKSVPVEPKVCAA